MNFDSILDLFQARLYRAATQYTWEERDLSKSCAMLAFSEGLVICQEGADSSKTSFSRKRNSKVLIPPCV